MLYTHTSSSREKKTTFGLIVVDTVGMRAIRYASTIRDTCLVRLITMLTTGRWATVQSLTEVDGGTVIVLIPT